MKKVISLLLAASMAVALCGCDSTSERGKYKYNSSSQNESDIKPEENARLTVWAADDQKEWLNKVIEKYKSKYSNYNVDVITQKVDDYNVVSKLKDDGPAKIGPDVFMCKHDSLGTLVSGGLVRENDVTADSIKKNCVSAAYNAACYDGRVYGYPMSLTTYVLMYNKKLVSKPATTFSEIKEFSKTFNDTAQNKYALVFPVTETFYVTSFIQGYDGYILGEDGTDSKDIGLNKEAAIMGLKFYQSLKQASPLSAANEDIGTCESLFGEGKIAYEIAQIWAIQSAQQQGIDVGFSSLPKMDNGKSPEPCATVSEMFVSTYAKYPKAAKLFASMATSDDMMKVKVKMQKLVPVSTALLNSDDVKNDEALSTLAVSARNAIPTSNAAAMDDVWDPYLRAVTTIWDNNNADVQKIMDECVTKIKQGMESKK
jgi:arabinogalactan oligomer / maltooligosaccharide transport system substrate-binding protein